MNTMDYIRVEKAIKKAEKHGYSLYSKLLNEMLTNIKDNNHNLDGSEKAWLSMLFE